MTAYINNLHKSCMYKIIYDFLEFIKKISSKAT